MNTTKTIRLAFNDSAYDFNYGHTPRGRGSWAFAFDRPRDEYFFVPGSCTYTEAKKEAARIINEARGKTLAVYDAHAGKEVARFIPDNIVQVTLYVCT